MKKIIRYPILKILHIIRFFLKYLIKFVLKTLVIIRNNAIPEIKLNKSKPKKTINIYNTTENIKKNYDQFIEDEYKDSYNYFKKYFYTSLMVNDRYAALRYAINKSLSNHEEDNLYLEFGVFVGKSINYTSKLLKDIKIYGFDSFEGLKEDWHANAYPKGAFNLNKKLPKLNHNVLPVVGWVQDTLPNFLIENKDKKINYVFLDLDTYPSTKYVLEKIKPHLKDKSIIVFDELYQYPGWRMGEFKALTEVFDENEFNYLCFANEFYGAVVIQYNKIN